LKENPQIS